MFGLFVSEAEQSSDMRNRRSCRPACGPAVLSSPVTDKIPDPLLLQLPKIFELVGLGYTTWFVYRCDAWSRQSARTLCWLCQESAMRKLRAIPQVRPLLFQVPPLQGELGNWHHRSLAISTFATVMHSAGRVRDLKALSRPSQESRKELARDVEELKKRISGTVE